MLLEYHTNKFTLFVSERVVAVFPVCKIVYASGKYVDCGIILCLLGIRDAENSENASA